MNRTRLTNKLGSPVARLIGVAIVLLLLALVVSPKIGSAAEGADQGKQLFEKRCTGCHSLDRNKEGPNLK